MRKALLLVLASAAGCFGSDPYRRLARELTEPLGKTPRRVAVLPFRGLDPSLNAEGEAISERLLGRLYGRGGVVLIERSRLQQVMSEMSLGQTGALDAASAAEVGRLSGAQALVVGTVARARKGLDLAARVVDVETGRLLAAASARLPEGRNLAAPPAPASRPVSPPAPLAPQKAEVSWRVGADLGDGGKAPWPLAVFGAAATAGRVYVIGGATDRVPGPGRGDSAVYSAPIMRGGKLGRWRAEEPLPEGRYQVTAAVWGEWVFAVGGYEGSPRDEVFAARVGGGGVLSAWKSVGRLPTGCTLPGAVAAAGKLHVAGCSAVSGQVHVLFSADVFRNGSLGEWLRTPLPESSGAGNTLVSDGRRLLLVGGSLDRGGFTDAVLAVPLGRLGTAEAAVRIGSLPVGIIGMAAAVSEGRLWLLGGKVLLDGKDAMRDVVESAELRASGDLGPWQRSPHRLVPVAFNPGAPLVDGVFYLVGGESLRGREDVVQRVPVR